MSGGLKLWGLFPAVLLGMAPGAWVLATVDHGQFRLILGWTVLVLLLLEICRQMFGWNRMPEQWWFIAAMGVLAGFSTLIGNAAGPVMSIYLIARGLAKEQFMGNWVWFFLIVNLCKVPVLAGLELITPGTLRFSLAIAAMVIVGAFVGRHVFDLIPQKVFDPLVLTLAGLAALHLIVA